MVFRLCVVPYDGAGECSVWTGQRRRQTPIREVFAEKIALLGLGGLERRFLGTVGRAAAARGGGARPSKPLVLLLDEPLSNLDAKLRRRVRDDIRDLQSRLADVRLRNARSTGSAGTPRQVIVMAQSMVAQGSPRELYEHPANHSSPI
jgi:iron(III) transport system ATP-binding protein